MLTRLPLSSLAFSLLLLIATATSVSAQMPGVPITVTDTNLLFGRALAFSPDGETIVAGSYEGYVSLWEASTGRLVDTLDRVMSGEEVYELLFSSTGDTIIGTTSEGRILLWERSTGDSLAEFVIDFGWYPRLDLGRDGRTLIVHSVLDDLRIIDLPTLRERFTIGDDDTGIDAFAIDPTSDRVITVGTDIGTAESRYLRSWDLVTGELIDDAHLPFDVNPYFSLMSFSGDGRRLAITSVHPNENPFLEYAFVYLIDAQTFDTIRSYLPPDTLIGIMAIDLDASGTRLVFSGGRNGYLWDVASGEVIGDFHYIPTQTFFVKSNFNPQGNRLAVLDNFATMRIWSLETVSVEEGAVIHRLLDLSLNR